MQASEFDGEEEDDEGGGAGDDPAGYAEPHDAAVGGGLSQESVAVHMFVTMRVVVGMLMIVSVGM